MASSRSMFFATLAFLFFTMMPGFAAAQHVHEVRPAAANEVRIGVEEGASMDAVVRLAQRITGNRTLTVEDVLDNLPHTRRYACYFGGRQVYFGVDPSYEGRCPERGRRRYGVIGGSVYRVPRVHGTLLLSHASRVTRHQRGRMRVWRSWKRSSRV